VGSTQDMAVKMFEMTAGIKLDPVLYKGAPPIIPDLVAGRLTMAIVAGGNATSQVRTGRLRALASTGASRSATTPDVPTMAESGYPDVTVVSWYGLHVPAGTSDAVVKTISDAVKAVAADPKVVELITTANGEVAYQNEAEFDRYLTEELARWTKVVAGVSKQ
jgi:tripartite-type tricarboxylate transporter receptor subunit TctC